MRSHLRRCFSSDLNFAGWAQGEGLARQEIELMCSYSSGTGRWTACDRRWVPVSTVVGSELSVGPYPSQLILCRPWVFLESGLCPLLHSSSPQLNRTDEISEGTPHAQEQTANCGGPMASVDESLLSCWLFGTSAPYCRFVDWTPTNR
jgi:hypothetical protein